MLTELRIQNFKSWADTGPMRFAPITGLFGANSSGKTSLLQLLLMLKQTVESTNRSPDYFYAEMWLLLSPHHESVIPHSVRNDTAADLKIARSRGIPRPRSTDTAG